MTIGVRLPMQALLVVVYARINRPDTYPKGSEPREVLKTRHFMLGWRYSYGSCWVRWVA